MSDVLEEARLIADTGRLLESPVLSAWDDTEESGRVGTCWLCCGRCSRESSAVAMLCSVRFACITLVSAVGFLKTPSFIAFLGAGVGVPSGDGVGLASV